MEYHSLSRLIVLAGCAITLVVSQQQPAGVSNQRPFPELRNPCWYCPLQVNNFTRCGAVVPLDQTKVAPRLYLPYADPDDHYIVLMVDPDALTRSCPSMAFIKHWLVSNVSGEILRRGTNDLEKEPGVIVHRTYGPPGPLTGHNHRYQILLLDPDDNDVRIVDDQPILNFDPNKLIRDYNLRPVCGFEFMIDTGLDDDCTKLPSFLTQGAGQQGEAGSGSQQGAGASNGRQGGNQQSGANSGQRGK